MLLYTSLSLSRTPERRRQIPPFHLPIWPTQLLIVRVVIWNNFNQNSSMASQKCHKLAIYMPSLFVRLWLINCSDLPKKNILLLGKIILACHYYFKNYVLKNDYVVLITNGRNHIRTNNFSWITIYFLLWTVWQILVTWEKLKRFNSPMSNHKVMS